MPADFGRHADLRGGGARGSGQGSESPEGALPARERVGYLEDER